MRSSRWLVRRHVRSLVSAAAAVLAALAPLAGPSNALADDPPSPPPAGRPSVLLIVVDTLRFDSGYVGSPRHDIALPAALKKHSPSIFRKEA